MTLHVIYGIACAGKSTTALRFASDNGIRTVVSTDCLREVQRLYVPAAQSRALSKVSRTAEAVFPAVEAVAAKLTWDGLDAVIEGSPFHGALITDKVEHRAPGAEPRGWRANARALMRTQDFLINDAARHAIPRMRAAQLILDGGPL